MITKIDPFSMYESLQTVNDRKPRNNDFCAKKVVYFEVEYFVAFSGFEPLFRCANFHFLWKPILAFQIFVVGCNVKSFKNILGKSNY